MNIANTEPMLLALKQQIMHKLSHCDASQVRQYLNILVQSDFLVEALTRYPHWLEELIAQPPIANECQYYDDWLKQQLINVKDETQLMSCLRQFRRYILVRLEWSQLLEISDTQQILAQLSYLAEVILMQSKDWLYRLSCQELGTPVNAQGKIQPFIIIAMGKLGGGELNFSSDIDLIFTYPEHGYTQGGRRELDNTSFFTRLGQRLIKTLNQITAEGFVYRVDMRLRPLGDSGPLVLSFSAMEDYYQEQGRDWERYAMIKAKIIGDQNDPYHQELYQLLKPFVYRRYIDFSVIQSLRNMKGMIEREVRRRGLKNNIKLGAGAIREIEFIVQVFQLIRGGRVQALQTRSLLQALTIIGQEGLLDPDQVLTLTNNYLYLRRVENLLQAINDEQTQNLPEDPLNQLRLTIGMQKSSWDVFMADLTARLQKNRHIFTQLIGEIEETSSNHQNYDHRFDDIWIPKLEPQDVKLVFNTFNEQNSQQFCDILNQFHQTLTKKTIGIRGREILDRLMPRLLATIKCDHHYLAVLKRVLGLLENIVSRTTYLELLLEYPTALHQLIQLCHASPMISDQLAHYPILLDELTDTQSLYKTLNIDEYKIELSNYLLRIPQNEEEQQLEALRQFKQMQLLHIAAADVGQVLTTMKVSDHLTYVAEALLDFVVQIAWRHMIDRYGYPDHLSPDQTGLLVIAFGKLGGLELGYGSDLDLVFLHDCPETSITNGQKSIDSRQFYLRLVQRILHLFMTRTSCGILYEIDLRLRPQGDAGLLATSLQAFTYYQQQEAWTWEHQALVRARPVYGEHNLVNKFNQIRLQILSQVRDITELKNSVEQMREKMRNYLGNKDNHLFNLKTDQGGINDIEFLSQYFVLAYAHQYPQLAKWTDNVRILAEAAKYNIIDANEAQSLTNVYIDMRNVIHQLSLQKKASIIDSELYQSERKQVIQIWSKWLR